ncbi:MAG: hypothetical protein R2867_35500 [Caldilineaceae bacterium]
MLQGNAPTVEQVGQLVYTEMVIKEALRLYHQRGSTPVKRSKRR